MARQAEREIEAVLRDRLGRECLFMPSGRIALWCALVALLEPGKRLLMSPVNDDVIFFIVLAAGLRPVMAPLSTADGNIDPCAVPDAVWSSVDGVLTTNLYGLPDRMVALQRRCADLGIPLIEDAAHAIETEFAGTEIAGTEITGRPVGTFGDVAGFSFSKHVGAGRGGALAFADPARRSEFQRIRDGLLRRERVSERVKAPMKAAVKGPVKGVLRSVGLLGRVQRYTSVRQGAYRMPLYPERLRAAVAAGQDLDRFDIWTRVDRLDYRLRHSESQLEAMLAGLRAVPSARADRVEGTQRLSELPAAASAVRDCPAQPLYRVPLLVDERDGVRARLTEAGIQVAHIYDPPLDDYAGEEFTDLSPDPTAARWFAAHALPVDPRDAGKLLAAVDELGIELTPAEAVAPTTG